MGSESEGGFEGRGHLEDIRESGNLKDSTDAFIGSRKNEDASPSLAQLQGLHQDCQPRTAEEHGSSKINDEFRWLLGNRFGDRLPEGVNVGGGDIPDGMDNGGAIDLLD